VSHPSSPRKILNEARRRGWLVLLAVALVGSVAWAAGRELSHTYSAEAVLVVRVGGPLATQPDASTKLAITYATLIPLDASLQAAVARALPRSAGSNFKATSDANTAVLRIDYKGANVDEATRGAAAVAQLVSGRTPATPSIAPHTISIVRLPSTATRSGGTPAQLAAVGAALGLLLGLVLVAFWRARDMRVDDVRDLRRALRCPCFAVDRRHPGAPPALVEAVAHNAPHATVVLPCRARDEQAASAVRAGLADALGEERALSAPPPGTDAAGELVAAGGDATVLVVGAGTRVATLGETLDVLDRHGATPSYAVLAGRRSARQPPGTVRSEETRASHPVS
jgi:capsular polysaccharide biosynthesis protein